MKHIAIIILLLINLNLKAQSDLFPLKLECGDFKQNISANRQMNIDFVNEERYYSLSKDSIMKAKKIVIENLELTKLFEKKFPKKITNHCINSKIYENDSIENISLCNEKYNIKLIDKKLDFYIFKLDAFEIDSYLLFNSKSQIIYSVSNFPQFLNDGKVIMDVGYEYGGSNIVNFYFIEEEKIKYFEYRFQLQYQIKDVKILNTSSKNPKILLDLIRYGYKEVPNKPGFGKKYDFDKENFCRKFILFN